MSDVVIRAEGLGKKYLIGHETERGSYSTLRETMARSINRLRRSAKDLVRGRPVIVGDEVEEFWALRDVDFEIRRGDVVGIIGRNGAGKSTLLKVLSRITEPTEGRVTIDGRVASLLEVGTGFHPELSGRENIFLNGSILGMTRKEIQSKFDEIVDFAGVEKFIDTPVKRYSSGMRVRLGFSVAAHLEPEILIVDEVLAVGDAEFQKRCLGKMQDVAGGGRTVLFVSHNMAAISTLCRRSILLGTGKIIYSGETDFAIKKYYEPEKKFPKNGQAHKKGQKIKFISSRVLNEDGDETTIHDSSRKILVEFDVEHRERIDNCRYVIIVKNNLHEVVFQTTDEAFRQDIHSEKGLYRYKVIVPANLLNTLTYNVFLRAGQKNIGRVLDETLIATIHSYCQNRHGSVSTPPEKWPGLVAPHVEWSATKISTEDRMKT